MADGKLNRLFLTYNSVINPGDELSWNTFEREVEDAAARIGLIRDQIDDANMKMEKGQVPNAGAAIFCNPILLLFQKLEFVVKYFYGEFEIKTSKTELREELAGIWYDLIKGWYFSEVYVGYGEDFENIDRAKFESDDRDFGLDGIPGKFRLFVKSGKDEFQSVLSGLSGIKFSEKQKKRIVKVSQCGQWNWLYWWHLWAKWIDGMERFERSVKELSKNVILTPKSETEVQSIDQQFENMACYIKREGFQLFGPEGSTPSLNKTKFEPIIFMPRETPMAILEGIQRSFELNAAHMGFAGKLAEQKAERVNAGENYPHQKVVSNVVTYLIGTLNYAFDRMRLAFGEDVIPADLEIIRTNQAFAQGLPDFQPGQPGGNFNQFDDQDEQKNDKR